MRSSMEHMRMIVQIQAQIDSCLVDEDGLLLSSSLAEDAGGEPDPRLVKQAIRLLRVRHRVLQVRKWSKMEWTAGRHRKQQNVVSCCPRSSSSSNRAVAEARNCRTYEHACSTLARE